MAAAVNGRQQRLMGWLLVGVLALAVVVDTSLPGRAASAFADLAQFLSREIGDLL